MTIEEMLIASGATALGFLAVIRRRRGIASDVGVGRTLRAALRRPLAEALTVRPESSAARAVSGDSSDTGA